MSFKQTATIPSNPNTARGTSTKLSTSKGKVVYANGKSIIIRDLQNPSASIAYSGHIQNTTVARISPSGYYCASADALGTVRIWDTVGEENVLKGEYKVISGKINDLEWDGESKRIIAVGDGKEKFGHAFMFDSGSSTGEIVGHSKQINAVSIRHQRPFRAATAADDALVIFYQGAPYKYDKTIKTHTKFVQDVRYAPSGDVFVSVGSDSKIFLYDGKTGDTLAEVTDSPHKGSIMASSWSPDSKSFMTSSADCTVKLWDVEGRKAVTTWTIGSGVDYQQVGGVWSEEAGIVSLSLNGDLNIIDPRTGDKPTKIIKAPQKAITAISPSGSGSGTFVAGTADGRILSYSSSNGESDLLTGENHGSLVTGLAPSPDGKIFSIGWDDRVREIEGGNSFTPASLSTSSQPKSIAVAGDSSVFVVEIDTVEVIRSNQKVSELKPKFTPSAVAASKSTIAIGGEDAKVRLYEWDGKELKETVTLSDENKSLVSTLAFSPDGKLLASGDSSGRIALFDVAEKKHITSRWSFHSARINSLSWTSDSKHCASGSLDTHVYIWSVAKPLKNIALKNVGPGGVNSVLWIDDATKDSGKGKLVSAGADGCVRVWEVTFHA